VLVTVIVVAMRFGVVTGAVVGFGAGLAWDLISPADGPVGGWALIYLLVGAAAGRISHPDDRPAVELLGIVAGLCAASVLGYAVLGWFLGDPRIDASVLLRTVPTAALYGALLTPFLLPLVQRLAPSRSEGAWL
jgi:rod shape-determining protein MreD